MNKKEIKIKSEYCLQCTVKPCSKKGCPLSNNIPDFISAVKSEDYKKAYEILSETTVLESICGRVCPHTKQCEGSCIRGIKSEPVDIGKLEAYVGDIALKEKYKIPQNNKENTNKKIAVIGSGPAGITASAFLLKNGYSVTMFEKYDYLGGLLIHGIPEFRLPKKIVEESIQKIVDLGLKVKYKKELGKNLFLEELKKEYDAILITCGANKSAEIMAKGCELNGVYGGNELLEHKNHPDYLGKKVMIIGGGNVAIDCARTIKKLGAEDVKIIYRRNEEGMPAERKEIESAKKENIEFMFKRNIEKVLGNQKVEKVELIKTEVVKLDIEERPVPINIPNTNHTIDADYVIIAAGSKPDEFVYNLGLEIDSKGYIKINKNNMTSEPKIFAAGDIAGCKSTVAWAARSGRDAAVSIIEYLK